jgi:hypothetical protein
VFLLTGVDLLGYASGAEKPLGHYCPDKIWMRKLSVSSKLTFLVLAFQVVSNKSPKIVASRRFI